MDATQEFLNAFALIPPAEAVETVEYRLHYNEAGDIILCTMQQHPPTTLYLVVDKEIYDTYFHYNIVNGQLKKIDRNPAYSVQLKKASAGQRVVKNHAGLALEDNEVFSTVEYYGYNN